MLGLKSYTWVLDAGKVIQENTACIIIIKIIIRLSTRDVSLTWPDQIYMPGAYRLQIISASAYNL